MNKKHTMPSRLIELEHELSAALIKVDDQRELLRLAEEENEEKRKDIVYLATENSKLEERIKRLEIIISRAKNRFFRDGSNGQAASGMLAILEEERRPSSDSCRAAY